MRHLWDNSLGTVQGPGWEPGGAGHGGLSEGGRQYMKRLIFTDRTKHQLQRTQLCL